MYLLGEEAAEADRVEPHAPLLRRCWDASFDTSTTKRNEAGVYKGKLPPPAP